MVKVRNSRWGVRGEVTGKSVNHLSPSTAKGCEMVPSKPCNSLLVVAAPHQQWFDQGGAVAEASPSSLARPLYNACTRRRTLTVLVYFPGQGIHSCSSRRVFFFFLKIREDWLLPEGNPAEQACSSSWCSCQHPSPACSQTKALLLRTEDLPPPVKVLLPAQEAGSRGRGTRKAEFSESQWIPYLLFLRLWQEV